MITTLKLQHFKCFAQLSLQLKPFTLLTGINAAGKSSVIQSILLLQQTLRENYKAPSLLLNGSLVQLGRFGEVVDEFSGRNEFSIEIAIDQHPAFWWRFQSDNRESLTAEIATCGFNDGEKGIELNKVPTERLLSQICLPASSSPSLNTGRDETVETIEKIVYLATDRIGPRETYAIDVSLAGDRDIGPKGEYTAWFIYVNREKKVNHSLCRDATATFERQTEAWLSYFFPGTSIEIEPIKGANLVSLRIRTTPDGSFHRPQNVGYGLIHLLPVIAASLAAEPGQVIVIENPEAHLHPTAQAKVGEFLARVASSGVQVICETHSDHILNGARRAVKDGIIQPDDVAVHFFLRRDGSEHAPQVFTPKLNRKGAVDHWPKGFFDQYDEDLTHLTDWPNSP